MHLEWCARCNLLLKCAARTPDVECWCASMPPLVEINKDQGCYCGQCYRQILIEQNTQELRG